MTEYIWQIFTYGALGICLIVTVYKTIRIARLPLHLRWELAPIPHEKGKNKYGGSYLEEFEWWKKARKKAPIAPIIYMAKEIFLLKAVWKNNKKLWPFSIALHTALYLFFLMIIFQAINALLSIAGLSLRLQTIIYYVSWLFTIIAYPLGILGSFTLILKRIFDRNLRLFSSFSRYFNLIFLLIFFISGGLALLSSADITSDIMTFIKDIFTFNPDITVSYPESLHFIIFLLFLIYLPLTDMLHPVIKFFTYHSIRWNDEPQDKKMKDDLDKLLKQPVTWSAAHIKADGNKNWAELATMESSDEKKS